MKKYPLIKFIFLLSLSLCLAGCLRPYRVTIFQGNKIQAETVHQLRPGMSRDQIQYLMGTPMLQDMFTPDRWDYIYYEKPGYKRAVRRQVTLYFTNDRVTEIQTDNLPSGS